MKNTIPKKIPVLFSRPKKIPASFIDPKKIPFGKNLRPKKILRTPPSLKYVSGAPGFISYGAPPMRGMKRPRVELR